MVRPDSEVSRIEVATELLEMTGQGAWSLVKGAILLVFLTGLLLAVIDVVSHLVILWLGFMDWMTLNAANLVGYSGEGARLIGMVATLAPFYVLAVLYGVYWALVRAWRTAEQRAAE